MFCVIFGVTFFLLGRHPKNWFQRPSQQLTESPIYTEKSVLNQEHLTICLSVQGCINSKLYMASFFRGRSQAPAVGALPIIPTAVTVVSYASSPTGAPLLQSGF